LQDTEISRNLSSNELNRQSSLNNAKSTAQTTESSPSRKRRATESNTTYTTNVTTPLLPSSTFDIDDFVPQETSNELYAVWLHAASVSDKHVHLVDKCYNNARKYLEKAESEDHMGTFISIDALQACILIALYEFKQVYFARGWMSIGRAMRLAQMLGLHKMDRESTKLETGFQPGLLPTNDPVELEERRRTFWTLYNVEWYASSRTRSPMNIDDTEITTFLPSGGSFDTETAIPTTSSLKEAMKQPAKACYTPFAGAVIMAAFTGRCLRHLQRSHKAEIEPDFSYDFWTQHYSIDQAIVQTFVSTLGHLNIPNAINNVNGTSDPNVLFLNMNMHTTVICLHQAAAMQAEKSGLPATVVMESEHRITTAAQQVANIMRLTQNSVHLVKLNMFTTWCLYCSARALVRTVKACRSNASILESLQLILSALTAFKISNPRTEVFINQINMELDGPDLPSRTDPLNASNPPSASDAELVSHELIFFPKYHSIASEAAHLVKLIQKSAKLDYFEIYFFEHYICSLWIDYVLTAFQFDSTFAGLLSTPLSSGSRSPQMSLDWTGLYGVQT
ncbi:MAG: hypothetical protein Q9214_003564, partial [Letrouitia sp. 1 TL-2023]